MKCEDVRILLAAYRRGEWSRTDQQVVQDHLVDCAACRRWEAEARQVGEALRQLPTISPPPSFRDRVFAAIQAEQVALERGVAPPLSPEDLPPAPRVTPAVAPKITPLLVPTTAAPGHPVAVAARVGEVGLRRIRPPRVLFGKFTAIATVAALLAIVFTSHILAILNVNTPNVPNIPAACVACSGVPAHADADSRYPIVTSVLADSNQIIYVAQNTAGQQMLFVRDRQNSQQMTPILNMPSSAPITLQALSSQVLVWLVGTPSGEWSLQSAPIATDGTVHPVGTYGATTLMQVGDTFLGSHIQQVNSVWAYKQTVLVAVNLADGSSIIETIDLSGASPVSTVIAQTSNGETLTDVALNGSTATWVRVMTGSDGIPHSVLIQQNIASGATSGPVTNDIDAYRPVVAGGHLAWFETRTEIFTSDGSGTPVLRLIGTIVTLNSDGSVKKLSGDDVALNDVWRGPGYILWRDSSGMHLYSVASQQEQDIGSIPTSTNIIGISAQVIAWTELTNANLLTSTIFYVNEGN